MKVSVSSHLPEKGKGVAIFGSLQEVGVSDIVGRGVGMPVKAHERGKGVEGLVQQV